MMPSLRLASIALLAVTLTVSLAVPAEAAVGRANAHHARAAVKLVRHNGTYWVWYGPPHWLADESSGGIDISSPTGAIVLGRAFAGPYLQPVTIAQVRSYLVSVRALDLHVLNRLRFTSASRVVVNGVYSGQSFTWTAVRADTRQTVKGVLIINVVDNPQAGDHGWDETSWVAPTYKRQFAHWSPILNSMRTKTFYKGRQTG